MASGQPNHLLAYGDSCPSRVLFRTAKVDQHHRRDYHTTDTTRRRSMSRLMMFISSLPWASRVLVLINLIPHLQVPLTRNL